jgi:glutaredoxin-like YruB-family protein
MNNTSSDTSTKSVTVYSADWCAFCHAAKKYLESKGISYSEKNIEDKAKGQEYAQECVDKSGQTGIPVIDIDGTIIVGFDRPKIDAALNI